MDYPPAPPPPKGRYSPIGLTRTSTPMPPGILKNGEGGGGGRQPTPPPSNPKRQRSASFKDMVVDECDENRTVATVPDNVSDTASETSSNGSYNNQPPLLDFMGSVCVASAWFTTCFPCAVVDINDTDDRVVRNLSRESAMNFMYSNTNDRFGGSKSPRRVTPEGIPVSDRKKIVEKESSSVPVVQATSNIATMPIQQQLPERAKSEPKLLNIPSIIEEDESSDDEMMDVVSLDSGTAKMNILAERRVDSSGGTTNTTHHQDSSASTTPHSKSIPCSQPRKNRFAMKNIFGRKKS
jgi:hypothetical protein